MRKLEEMVQLDRVAKASTLEQAAQICECQPHELIIQKLGEKEEGQAKSRTYLDCTVTGSNGKIKAKDQVECLGLAEQENIMM